MIKKTDFLLIAVFSVVCATAVKASGLQNNVIEYIDADVIRQTIDTLKTRYPQAKSTAIEKGVSQAARFWIEGDGSKNAFISFCKNNFIADTAEKKVVLEKFSKNLEILYGYYNMISLNLKEPLHMNQGPITTVDQLFGGLEPSSHLTDDFFQNKTAFFILLNFPHYTLSEKSELGREWSRETWAGARLADIVKSRIPGELILKSNDILTQADSYISDYNIFMGNLINAKQERLFPADMKLIAHWGLRDELKANYNAPRGLEKQHIIYDVMKRIIHQDIPSSVINSGSYRWNPTTNLLSDGTKTISFAPEPDTRFEWLLANFKALKAMDAYNPLFPTYIMSKFEGEMEIPQQDVEKLFTELVSSPEVKKVAMLIQSRLKRKLEPFDIWYDGFKARSGVNVNMLDSIIQKRYPNSEAFQHDLPLFLQKLGFTPEKATFIASKIQVEAARGSGHAWGALRKGDKAHLRTRIGKDGMDYKGFNIAIHEFGHCVEQTLTLYDMDHYLLNGIPNTAFTEALAFTFQKRDLELLGIPVTSPLKDDFQALDIFWSNYEIMGVSLVDMKVWQWMYKHPDANKSELKNAVITIAIEIWNKYYAPVFGIRDEPILAIYSHMIDNPLYLSAYPIGYLIHFQLEKQVAGKNFANEIMRIYSKGRVTPQLWLEQTMGEGLTNKPLLEAVDKALKEQ